MRSTKEQGKSMTQLALEGLRILDLTQVAVGPYATLLLGFMGAEWQEKQRSAIPW